MRSNSFFETEKPHRLFFKVAIPGMISMLAMSIYSVVEGAFIGKWIGEAAFAAVNIAFPFVMINFSLADMIGVGSSVPISIALGRKDHARANQYFTCSLFLIVLAALFLGSILFFASPVLVTWMGAEGELATYAVRYVRVYALLGPLTTLVFAMDNYLRISGYVRSSMVLNIFMSCLTAALLFVFIGVLDMNVDGSALATCLSMTFCACLAMIPFLRGKAVLKFVHPKLTFDMIRQIVACGSPIFLNNISGRVAAIVMNVVLLKEGGQTAVAAYSVLMYAGEIINPLLYGMSDSVQPAIGYNWGSGAFGRVRDIAKWSFGACAVVSAFGTLGMYLFPEAVASLFVQADDLALMELSVHALKLFSTAFVFRWFGFVVQGFFSAIEKPLLASLLSVASAMVFPIIFIFALSPLGLDGLWLNFTATSFCVSAMALFMLLGAQKRLKRQL